MNNKQSIYSFTLQALEEKIVSLGLKKYNALQIFQWIYQKNCQSFLNMSNIAKTSLAILENNFEINKLQIENKWIDENDGTIKFLFKLGDGQHVETVVMKFDYGYSVCISTQVGCNMGCKFCASGLLKKIRNLSTDEMVLQILGVNEYLQRNSGAKVSNVVVMGIGEPFDNYENLSNALKIIKENHAIGIGSRHITVSTCGVAPKIIEFGNDFNQINLAISLHAPNNEIRDKIMPVNKAYPLQVLFNALRKYSSTVNRKITFEYLLLGGVNDSVQNAVELSKLVKEFECYVNLIIYNSVDEHSFKRSANSKSFAETLIHNGVKVTTRLERGSRISAACGQLRANHEKNK